MHVAQEILVYWAVERAETYELRLAARRASQWQYATVNPWAFQQQLQKNQHQTSTTWYNALQAVPTTQQQQPTYYYTTTSTVSWP